MDSLECASCATLPMGKRQMCLAFFTEEVPIEDAVSLLVSVSEASSGEDEDEDDDEIGTPVPATWTGHCH